MPEALSEVVVVLSQSSEGCFDIGRVAGRRERLETVVGISNESSKSSSRGVTGGA